MKFLDILRRRAPTTSVELAAALAEAEQAARDADARVEALTAERGRLLLDGDDKAVDKAEAELATAARDSDRADLACEELRRRLATTADAERQAELDATYETAMAAQARGIAALKRYAKDAPKLAAVLAEIDTAEIEIARHRATLEAANDPRRGELTGADRSYRPVQEGRLPHPTLVQMAEIPSVDPDVSLWPPVTRAAAQGAAAARSTYEGMRHFGPYNTPVPPPPMVGPGGR